MAQLKKVRFEIHSGKKGFYGVIQIGSEIVFTSEIIEDKRNVLKTMKSAIAKIQAGLIDVVEIDKYGKSFPIDCSKLSVISKSL